MRRKSFFSVSSAMRIALEFKTFDSTNSPKIICQTRKSKLRLILYKAFGSANEPLERFSNDCRQTKTKAITPTNHNRSRQRDEPITIRSNYL